MMTPLVPRELYLIERFMSLDHFAQTRDAWAAAVQMAEAMLARFLSKLPADYRNRPLPNQPDRVWGERVLPNFRDTLDGLNRGFIQLSHGDLDGLGWASGIASDLLAQRADYPEDWMDEVEAGAADRFSELAGAAQILAKPIDITYRADWLPEYLTRDYERVIGLPVPTPASWPAYAPDARTRVKTGDPIPVTGLYLPDVAGSAPNLLLRSDPPRGSAPEAPVATVRLADGTRCNTRGTTWTLVKRRADSGGGDPEATDLVRAGVRLRCRSGDPCPRTGVWFTPARLDSRQRFTSGDTMPDVGGTFGDTIWQWDEQQ